MYGNRLNPNSAMAALIAQSENSQAGKFPAAGDKSNTCQTRGFLKRLLNFVLELCSAFVH